jgi:hypothetical protein
MVNDHSDTMNRANARGLTFNGVAVRVAGSRLDYAQVSVTDAKSPFYGWQTEYAWPTIERAISVGKIR